MKHYDIVKKVRELYLKIRKEYIIDSETETKIRNLPYKGIKLYIEASKIILKKGINRGEVILKDGEEYAKKQKEYFLKKLSEFEKYYEKHFPKETKKKDEKITTQKVILEKMSLKEFLKNYDPQKECIIYKRLFFIRFILFIPIFKWQPRYILTKNCLKRLSKMSSMLEKHLKTLKEIRKHLLEDEEIIDGSVYNFCYLIENLFSRFILFVEEAKKSKGELNKNVERAFLDFYRYYLSFFGLNISNFVHGAAEIGRIIGAINTPKKLEEFYSIFLMFFDIEVDRELLLSLKKNNIGYDDNLMYFAIIFSVIKDKPTFDIYTIKTILGVFDTIKIEKYEWLGEEEILKKYKKDKDSIEKKLKQQEEIEEEPYIDKGRNLLKSDKTLFRYLYEYAISQKSIETINKDNFIQTLDLVLEGFFLLYKDFIVGNPVALEDKAGNSIFIPILNKSIYKPYVDAIEEEHKNIYELSIKEPEILSQEDIEAIFKKKHISKPLKKYEEEIINTIERLTQKIDNIIHTLLNDIKSHDREKKPEWEYIVKEKNFEGYKVYNYFLGNGLVDEIFGALLQINDKLSHLL